jgi:hypothetical protein
MKWMPLLPVVRLDISTPRATAQYVYFLPHFSRSPQVEKQRIHDHYSYSGLITRRPSSLCSASWTLDTGLNQLMMHYQLSGKTEALTTCVIHVLFTDFVHANLSNSYHGTSTATWCYSQSFLPQKDHPLRTLVRIALESN